MTDGRYIEVEVERADQPGSFRGPTVLRAEERGVFGRHNARRLLDLDAQSDVFFPLDLGAPDQRIHGRWAVVWFDEGRWLVANTGSAREISIAGEVLDAAREGVVDQRTLDPGIVTMAFRVEDRDYRVRLRVPGPLAIDPNAARQPTGTMATPQLGLNAAPDHALAISVMVYGGRRYYQDAFHPTPLKDKQIHMILREVDQDQDRVKDGAARVQKAYDLARRRYVETNGLEPSSFTGPDGRHEHYAHLVRAGHLPKMLALYREVHPGRPDPIEHFRALSAARR